MALARPRFSRPLILDPLPHRGVTRSKNKYANFIGEEKFCHQVADKKRLLAISTSKSTVCTAFNLPEYASDTAINGKTLGSYDFEIQKRRKNALFLNAASSNTQVNTGIAPPKQVEAITSNRDPQTEDNSAKRVSFNLLPKIDQDSKEHKSDFQKKESKPTVLIPTISTTKGQITKQKDDVTSLYERLLLNNKRTMTTEKHISCQQQAHKSLNGRSNEASNFKKISVTEKIQTRRVRGYLVRHRLPKLPKRSANPSLIPFQDRDQSPQNSVIAKARKILLHKMQNQSNVTTFNPKRVIILPSLAARCSEEFVITMRRMHGNKFVSSPSVLDHAVKSHVPLEATASLLDAILRPPSTPIGNGGGGMYQRN